MNVKVLLTTIALTLATAMSAGATTPMNAVEAEAIRVCKLNDPAPLHVTMRIHSEDYSQVHNRLETTLYNINTAIETENLPRYVELLDERAKYELMLAKSAASVALLHEEISLRAQRCQQALDKVLEQ